MIRTIIIDDEIDARAALKNAVEMYCPEIDLLAVCNGAIAGLAAIKEHAPDLVFLDIQMPHTSGFELLQQLESVDFAVIFVTAYDRYAIKAIKFSALDYLLKPLDIDDLQMAVKRYLVRQQKDSFSDRYDALFKNVQGPHDQFEKLAVPTMEGMAFFPVKDIIYCQAEGNYTEVYLDGQSKTLVSRTLKEFEQLLSDAGFCRVHHASLINLKHIHKYVKGEGGYVILSGGHHVNISRRKKDEFLRKLSIL